MYEIWRTGLHFYIVKCDRFCCSEDVSQTTIPFTFYCLYQTVKNALAVGMLLLVVLAAIVYAVGQVMGAETRARASVWATAMFVGAIMAALLYVILPFVLKSLFTGDTYMEDTISDIDSPNYGQPQGC